ncbi:MAG: type I phosphomannose isomerase catalytic subunit [Patescibacteria group bacterium]|nr:type I phosphomannose isomerase catalytic subunit [Patescibacteria group bacterium]
MQKLYPLRFQPILKQYLWGGRRLGLLLNKPLGQGEDYAESWEVVDHGEDQSVVDCGPLAGMTLGQLTRERGEELLGCPNPLGRFPLLLKFLDARKTLSVQVHPNDEQAAMQTPPDAGKTEAWVVLAAEPGSLIYAGLKPDVDLAALRQAIHEGTCEQLLHRFEPAVGDCVFLPAGTVHALGAGIVVAEIQQSSNTTYRLFDWNRMGPDGKPRQLHVEEALRVVDLQRGPVVPRCPCAGRPPWRELLVECDLFHLQRTRLTTARLFGGDHRCQIVSVLEGTVRVAADSLEMVLATGSTVLLPASIDAVEIVPEKEAVLLGAYLP